MGIKALSQFLRKKYPEIFKTCYLEQLRGSKIAIDTSILMYKYMSVSKSRYLGTKLIDVSEINEKEIKNIWISFFINDAIMFLSNKIIPIYVFDGVAPDEKKETLMKRKEVREKREEKIEELSKAMVIKDIEELEVDEVEKLLNDNIEIKKMIKNDINITKEDTLMLKNLFSSLGIPIVQSNCDAEKTCTMLCRDKKVNCVYSSDTDLIALGCPVSIIKIETNGEKKIVCTYTEEKDILEKLNLTKDELTDFCILCGCDYNQNMSKVGPVKSLSLIRELHGIDIVLLRNLYPESETSKLKYEVCRKLFSSCPCQDVVIDSINLSLDLVRFDANCYNTISEFGLSYLHQKLKNCFDNFRVISFFSK